MPRSRGTTTPRSAFANYFLLLVNMMGSTTPFYTKSYKSTSESEMTGFVTSSRNSGFSTASKGSESRSGSGNVKVNAFFAGRQINSKFIVSFLNCKY